MGVVDIDIPQASPGITILSISGKKSTNNFCFATLQETMMDSLFLSPAFILAETSFILVASIAAYELLVGDFIWAQQEEARRTRGRSSGYNTFDRASQQLQLHGHRSLSPGGGRGRGGAPRNAPSSRRGPNDESSLLYPPRSRGNRDVRVAEESYYSSSGDTRFASPGRGSSGDSTRRLFYKVILLALLSRFILLPVETFCFSQMSHSYATHRISPNVIIDPTLLQILLRISQTLPDVVFASALGLLVIFCAQIAFAAMPPLTPQSGETSIHGDEDNETLEDGITEGDGLLGEGTIKEQENMGGKIISIRPKIGFRMAHVFYIGAARLSRAILTNKKTFTTWNVILLVSYISVFVVAGTAPQPPPVGEMSLWIEMVAIHSFLLLSLIYVAVLLGKALCPGMIRRKNVDSLALRLIGTCSMLAIMLIERMVRFSLVMHRAIADPDNSDLEERIRISYRMSTIEYAVSESLPVLFILFLMHRKRKEMQNDVLIIHSIMNTFFGSSTQLDNTNLTSAQGDGTGSGATKRGGLGSRRFQTYGGSSRENSFPPSTSSNKTRRNIPRASSSGGGRPKQQQHHVSGTDVPASERAPLVGNIMKGDLKSYAPIRQSATGGDER